MLNTENSKKRRTISTSTVAEAKSDDVDATQGSTSTKKMKISHIKFQDDWLLKFQWLETNTTKDRLFCKLCRKHNKYNVFTKEGSTSIQKSALDDHNKSADHSNAMKGEIQNNKNQPKLTSVFSAPRDENESTLANHFRTCYFLAKNNLSVNLSLDLFSLCKLNGAKILDHYKDHNAAREVILSASECIDSQLLEELRESDFISLLLDESDDESEKKQLIVVVRCVKDLLVTEKYFAIRQVTDATAQGLYLLLSDLLSLENIDTNKIVSLATDGAHAMMGIRAGLTTLFKNNFPHVRSIHCMSHRLNLAIQVFLKYFHLDNLIRTIYKLCDFVHDSYKRRLIFENVQLRKGLSNLALIIPFASRWWATYESLKRLLERYSETIEALNLIATEHKDITAAGYARFLTRYENTLDLVIRSCIFYTSVLMKMT